MRTIDKRFVPPVAGIDLVQAMNYIDLDDVGAEFIYDNYTSSHIFHKESKHPVLESIITANVPVDCTQIETVKKLTRFVAEEVKWAGFYFKESGCELPKNRGIDETAIVQSKYGWCNEQARVLCCLTQMCDIPSRLVFASNPKFGWGHVLVEVLLQSGWMLVDQSLNFLFEQDGNPVHAADVSRNESVRAYFEPIYKNLIEQYVLAQLPLDYLSASFSMALADNPIDGFAKIGYHNHHLL